MSKGSWKRPVHVDHETYSRNFNRIFGKPKEDEAEDETGPTKKALQQQMEQRKKSSIKRE